MTLPRTFGSWDIVLVLVVTAQATVTAYVHQPRLKALVLAVPLPFTLAYLALGRRVDVTNVTGALLILILVAHGVRVLHYGLRLPIVPSVVAAALCYSVAGGVLARVLPRTDVSFWTVCAITLVVAATLHRMTPHREEPGHRTPLPVYIKAPIVAAVVVAIVLLKELLRGFMTVFPMVGVVTLYEARHSLTAVCRQTSIFMVAFISLLIVVRLTEARLGLGPALGAGWVVFLCLLVPLTRAMWAAAQGDIAAPPSEQNG